MVQMAKTTNIYTYPVDLKYVNSVVEATSSGSHSGPYEGSVDFAVPIDTSVFAAEKGIVRRVRDDSSKYGNTQIYGNDANYITIEHANDELSEYLHLAKDSALVKVGDKVKSGQAIAKTGLSGWLHAPHLHFMVYIKTSDTVNFQCMKIKFRK